MLVSLWRIAAASVVRHITSCHHQPAIQSAHPTGYYILRGPISPSWVSSCHPAIESWSWQWILSTINTCYKMAICWMRHFHYVPVPYVTGSQRQQQRSEREAARTKDSEDTLLVILPFLVLRSVFGVRMDLISQTFPFSSIRLIKWEVPILLAACPGSYIVSSHCVTEEI